MSKQTKIHSNIPSDMLPSFFYQSNIGFLQQQQKKRKKREMTDYDSVCYSPSPTITTYLSQALS